ncbi:MAG TPA: EAL domain-containing protein [Solirubrobacteraceae bacterium]|nr:EAL domain-containing protein [Solirubrobacteraceae bacterium]
MRPVSVALPAQRTALITRAVGAAWPLQVLVVALWLLVPHSPDAREGWVIALTLATAPLHVPLLLARPPASTRARMNVASALGIAQMCALVWAGGGLTSGFALMTLWLLPMAVCALPRRDVAAQIALIVAGCALAAVVETSRGDHETVASLWGFAVVAIATVVVNTAMVGFLYGQLRATTADYQRRSVEDALTGLANRTLLHERLDALDVASARAVYVIDVDGFKFVNDSLGHHAGDGMLALVAERLSHHTRPGDLLARPGGDEFVLVADGIRDDETALALGRRLADSCVEPLSLHGEEVEVSVTVGVRLVVDAASGEEALRDADLALYAAKTERRGSVKLFEAPMREAATTRLTLEQHLRRALDRGELHVVYQPVVDVRDSSIVGMEALLRWRSAALGDVSPAQFITIAERTGLILPIGRFVLAQAIERLAAWHAAGHDVRVSVNLSASQLADEQLPELLEELLETHGAPADRLLLELTETALMHHATDQPLQMLDRLRAAGAGLVLDDFGTGYSSLSRLSRLRLAAVKIDRAFIAAMEIDHGARAVVTAVLQMAGPLGCAVVAEGIETSAQRELLAELGCPRAQGYLFGRPQPPAEATAALEAGRAAVAV